VLRRADIAPDAFPSMPEARLAARDTPASMGHLRRRVAFVAVDIDVGCSVGAVMAQ
jgi:hypothetical protein